MPPRKPKPDPLSEEVPSSPKIEILAEPDVAAAAKEQAELGATVVEEMKKSSRLTMLTKLLTTPFEKAQVNWAAIKQDERQSLVLVCPFVHVLHYIDRLDSVFGTFGWEKHYELLGNAWQCHLSVEVGDGETVQKSAVDASPDAAFMKACTMFGIGTYLFQAKPCWCKIENGIVHTPELPPAMLPKVPLPQEKVRVYFSTGTTSLPSAETVVEPEPPAKVTPKPEEPPKPPPAPPKEEKKEKKSDEEITRERLKYWNEKLTACERADDLNGMLPALKTEPEFTKAALWKMIQSLVPDRWKYNSSTKKFYEVEPEEPPMESGEF